MSSKGRLILLIAALVALLFVFITQRALAEVTMYEECTSGKCETQWVAEDQGVIVTYKDSECGYLSRYVLDNVRCDANAGVFDWRKMSNKQYRDMTLSKECKRLTKEMNRLKEAYERK